MNVNTVCTITFFIAVSVIVTACVFVAIKSYTAKKNKAPLKNPVFVILISLFIAGFLMFLPVYLDGYFSDGGFLGAIKAIGVTIHNTMRLFILDGEFDAIRDLTEKAEMYSWLSKAYSVFGAIMFVIAPVMTVGFVLSFFKNATAYIKYAFCLKKEIYYMSELNSHSLLLTENARNSRTGTATVFLNCQNADEELINRARELGAICLNADVNEIRIKSGANVVRKIYFISTDENKNLDSALSLINKFRGSKYDNNNTQAYVFATGKESELLLNSADNGEIKVRRIQPSRNFVLYSTLRKHPIFNSAIDENGVKKINLLVVGMGKYGEEMVKATCWLGQMPNYEVSVHVIDVKNNLSDVLGSRAPEFIKYNGSSVKGEAQYKITFYDGIDVKSDEFRKILQKVGKITSAYTMLGCDALNIETAIKIREEFGRLNISNGYPVPSIYAVVKSSEQNGTISSNGELISETGKNYGIQLIGDEREEYSIDVIEQAELEEKGLKCHLNWSTTSEEIAQNTKKYDKYEYYRRSSMAEALYSEQRVNLGILLDGNIDNEVIKEYEHRRWNAYMRSEGFVYGKVRDDIAKTHPSLIPYEELSQKEKGKDEVVLKASEKSKSAK